MMATPMPLVDKKSPIFRHFCAPPPINLLKVCGWLPEPLRGGFFVARGNIRPALRYGAEDLEVVQAGGTPYPFTNRIDRLLAVPFAETNPQGPL